MSFKDFTRTEEFKLLIAAAQEEEEARMRRLAEMARTEPEGAMRYEAGVIQGLRVAMIALPSRIIEREEQKVSRPLYTMSDTQTQPDDGY